MSLENSLYHLANHISYAESYFEDVRSAIEDELKDLNDQIKKLAEYVTQLEEQNVLLEEQVGDVTHEKVLLELELTENILEVIELRSENNKLVTHFKHELGI